MQAHPLSANARKSDRDSQAFFYWAGFMKKVYGVGVNDAGYQTRRSKKKNGRRIILWSCPFYTAWVNMLQRSYSPSRHARNPSYSGCSVSEEWHSFFAFRKWMTEQNWQGKHLDKDILYPGNKMYSPDTCVFVDSAVNKLLCDAGAIRGEWPIGVCWAKREQKFLSRCCNPENGKHEFLGYFDCPNEAHEAWRVRKHELACKYADIQEDARVAQALRTRYLPNKEVI